MGVGDGLNRIEGMRVPDLFSLLDSDSSGMITLNEMTKFLQLMNVDLRANQIQQLMGQFDRDQDGSIHYQEFLRVVMARVGS